MSKAPVPPPTAPIAKTKTREFVMKSQSALIDTYSWECCLNCEHWSEDKIVQIPDETKYSGHRDHSLGPGCSKFGEHIRPPTKVILIGCESYEPSIPF